ncbi:MAG: glycosyltransferase [Myxococcaceae bacterium]
MRCHRSALRTEPTPIRLVEFTKAFWLGGTEYQVIELLRGLGTRYDVRVAVLDEVGQLIEEVWRLGKLPRSFPLGGSYLSANTLKQIARMAWWLRHTRAELVHVHDFYSTLVAVPAARLARVKVVVGRLDLLHWHGPTRAAVLGVLTRAADAVIVNALAVRGSCLAQGVAPERITLIRNGIDLPRFDARARLPLEGPVPDVGGAPLAVLVANMSHEVKRQEDFLRALSLVRPKVGPVHAYLVGDGSRRGELEALARGLGLLGLAHFLGFRKDTPAIQARATFGVLCSAQEGLSNAVIEGMAARLPMIVTRVGGNPELVTDGERGVVVEPKQPEQLARAMVELLTDRGAARRMGEAGREYVEKELTLEALVENHDRLYRRLARPWG